MSKKKVQTPIDPKRFYTLGEIVREGLIPGMDTIPKMSRLVYSDLRTNKILNAMIVPRGRNVSYQIRGSNIINYLTQTDDNG